MHRPRRSQHLLAAIPLLAGCGDDGGTSDSASATTPTTPPITSQTEPTSEPTTAGTAATDSGSLSDSVSETGTTGVVDPTVTGGSTTSGVVEGTGSTAAETGDMKFDMPQFPDMGPPPDQCKVVDDMDAVGDCTDKAPPDSFDPEVQWTFNGPAGFNQSIVMPLVANLTDDNGDGEIDLCDVPDVVIVAGPGGADTPPSRLYVLDGLTGVEHFFAQELVQFGGTPALGDIDGDGLPEIVALSADVKLVAFEHDGSVKWKSAQNVQGWQSSAVGLADVDEDGDVEIFVSNQLFDHMGNQLWAAGPPSTYSATMAANLDGQPGLEVLNGATVVHSDGSPYFNAGDDGGWIHPQVANFDADPEPEVLLAKSSHIELLQHDGAMIWSFTPNNQGDLNRPINIHDFDGDQKPEFGASAPAFYGIYHADHTPLWEAMVMDPSGQAGGTAFDFIGGGKAQAIYADEFTVYVFDENGAPLMSTPHLSGTIIEYPVVADIDNDGSSEIVVVSNNLLHGDMAVPFTAQAVKDVEDRWVQGRRIWNQHTYHVTNVREDGTIPQTEKPHWQLLNTFRTQAQIGSDGVCLPPPQ